jgi:SAM-dependent methyltransferase
MKQIAIDCAPTKAADISSPPIDFHVLKGRQRSTWASGNYALIGLLIQIVGETLAESVDLRAGERVLDVAAGTGNATLAAARRFAEVTSTDFVPELLDRAAERVRAEGLYVRFEVADAEALPYSDESFDVALSTFGVMFTPQHKIAADELLRVVRPGGRIGLANWTPEGFLGDLFRLIGSYVPPVAGLKSPMLWGSESHIVELFGSSASDISCTRHMFNFRFKSAAHWIEHFRTCYGPIQKAFAGLEPESQAKLTSDLTVLLEGNNIGGPNSLVVPAEYLEVVVTRR